MYYKRWAKQQGNITRFASGIELQLYHLSFQFLLLCFYFQQFEGKEDEEAEEDEEEFLDEAAAEVTRNVVRMNLKKDKEMISQFFIDKDDVYVSSDDEETETRLVKEQPSYEAVSS